jgi:hypothetical protein
MIKCFLPFLLLMCFITFIDLYIWTTPASLVWTWLVLGKWSFLCVLGFSLP